MSTEFSTPRPGGGSSRPDAAAVVAEPGTAPETVTADAVVLFLAEGGVGSGAAAAVDAATGGLLSRLASAGEITGKRYECVPLLAPGGMRAGQVVVAGIGKREEFDAGVAFDAFEAYVVGCRRVEQQLPEVLVFDGLLGSRFPAVSLPVLEPALGERLFDVG